MCPCVCGDCAVGESVCTGVIRCEDVPVCVR
jgi:hypothetical protein